MERTVKYYQTIQVGLAAVEIKSKPQRQVQRWPIFKGDSLLRALSALQLWVWAPALDSSIVLREGNIASKLSLHCQPSEVTRCWRQTEESPDSVFSEQRSYYIVTSEQRCYYIVTRARGIIVFWDQFFNLQAVYTDPRSLSASSEVRILCYWKAFLPFESSSLS